MAFISCRECEVAFESPRHRGRPTVVCSGCRVWRRRAICSCCGMSFDVQGARGPRPGHCDSCTRKPPRSPRPERPTILRDCLECATEFVAWHPIKKYCSVECQHLASDRSWTKKRERTYNDASRSRDARRRALKTHPGAEKISAREVAERDAWICGLCSRIIDPALRWPHPSSLTVDHIHPLSLGGQHIMANVQAAHAECNTRKGNRVVGVAG